MVEIFFCFLKMFILRSRETERYPICWFTLQSPNVAGIWQATTAFRPPMCLSASLWYVPSPLGLDEQAAGVGTSSWMWGSLPRVLPTDYLPFFHFKLHLFARWKHTDTSSIPWFTPQMPASGLARPKPRVRNSTLVSQVGGRNLRICTTLLPPKVCFGGTLDGSADRNKTMYCDTECSVQPWEPIPTLTAFFREKETCWGKNP